MNKSSYNYYFIFSLSPFYFPVCVNNILERDNEEETPIKWGKKRLKIFPKGYLYFSLRENNFFLKGNKIFP